MGGKTTISGVSIEQNYRIGNDEEKAQRWRKHNIKDLWENSFSVVSQFMHDPRERHLQAVNRIIRYLKASLGKRLLFKKRENLSKKVYTDVDYVGSIVNRRSTTGYCMLLGGNLVTWRSKKQNVVARSSAKVEFRAMTHRVCELLWTKIILDDLKIKYEVAMGLACDNKSAISIAHNSVQHDRTKHIEIDRQFIKEKLDNGLIVTEYIPSKLQLADMFTKGISTKHFKDHTCKLGMIHIHHLLEGECCIIRR